MAFRERRHPSADHRGDDIFKLYVTNLPPELSEVGIAQIFREFGNIEIKSPHKSGWAFVVYKTYREAENAIRVLNDSGPLYLKVAFAQKKARDNETSYTPGVTGPLQEDLVRDLRYADNGLPPTSNGRHFMPGMLGYSHGADPYVDESDVVSVYPNDMDHNIYNPFESVGRYADTNAMWSRGCISVDDFGKRHVSMGRGFTRYRIPEPHPNLERHISKVYENRRADLYEYGEDRVRSQVGQCQYCNIVTTLKCEQCGAYYCSRDCQVTDWPRHKIECTSIPEFKQRFHRALTGGVMEMPSISRSSSEEQLFRSRIPAGDLRGRVDLRRPKVLSQLDIKSAAENNVISTIQRTNGIEKPSSNDVETKNNITIDEKPPATPVMDPSQPIVPNFHYNGDPHKKSNGIGYSNPVQQQNYNRGYDQKRHAFNDNRGLNKSHNSQASSKENLSGALKSISVSDQAKIEKIEANIEFERDPRAHINTDMQASAVLPIKTTPAKATIVEPINAIFPKDSYTKVIVVFPMSDGTFWVQRKKDLSMFENMMLEMHTKTPLYPLATELVVGEMYGVQYNDIWHRATIISKNPTMVFYVDFGNDEPPQSDQFRSITDFPHHPPYAHRLRFSAGTKNPQILEEMELSVKMVNVDENGIVEVENESVIAAVEIPKNVTAVVETPDAQIEAAKIEAARKAEAVKIEADRKAEAAKTEAAKIEAARKAEAAEIEAAKAEASKIEAARKAEAAKAEAAKAEAAKIEAAKAEAARKAEAAKVEAAKIEAARKAEISALNESKAAALKSSAIVKKPVVKLPSGLDRMQVGNKGILQVYSALDNNSYAGCVLDPTFTEDFGLIFESIIDTCNAITYSPDFKPQIGEFVCGQRGETWVRGYVSATGPPIRLALVDEARISPVDKVISMPKEYTDIHALGAICTFGKLPNPFAPDDTAEFVVNEIATLNGERLVKGILESPDELKGNSLILKNWSPTPEQKGIGFADLKSNSQVCITAYSSERIMFVRSLDTESVERAARITQDVAKWAQGAPKLTEPPIIGQVVTAKFSDGNFYRAIVTKFKDDKFAVSYVDYGNRDFVTIDDLRMLSDELKAEKSCVAKVILKDVTPDVPPTQEVHNYLNILVGKEESLFCTFEGIPSKDGVILTTSKGECINLKVNELLTPSWKREDPSADTHCFTLVDLDYADLGEIGKISKAICLVAGVQPFKYFMCAQNAEHISHVTSLMPTLLREYCESTKDHYIPRATELCLAIYDGEWYRGVCLNPSATPIKAQIHFFDFGNIDLVDHKNIRQITKDFLSPAALACLCVVKNLGITLVDNEIPANIKARLDALIPINDVVDIKVLKKVEDGDYEIELPTVREILVKEGLVK